MMPFDPKNWFWIVGGDTSKAWSSAAAAYVTSYDEERVTRIANEVELFDVLAKSSLKARAPQGPFEAEDVRAAFLNIDAATTGEARDAEALAAVAEEIGLTLPPLAA